MPHSMNANWFIFFPKEVVLTSVKQLIDFLDRSWKNKKSPKPSFNLLKLAVGIFDNKIHQIKMKRFQWLREQIDLIDWSHV